MLHEHGSGSIELVCGSMFSGKTEELLRRIRRAEIARRRDEVVKRMLATPPQPRKSDSKQDRESKKRGQ